MPIVPMPIPVPTHPVGGMWRKVRNVPRAPATMHDLKAMLDEMRTERDAWREQAQRLALPKPEPAA